MHSHLPTPYPAYLLIFSISLPYCHQKQVFRMPSTNKTQLTPISVWFQHPKDSLHSHLPIKMNNGQYFHLRMLRYTAVQNTPWRHKGSFIKGTHVSEQRAEVSHSTTDMLTLYSAKQTITTCFSLMHWIVFLKNSKQHNWIQGNSGYSSFTYLCRSTISLFNVSSSLIAEKSATEFGPGVLWKIKSKHC